MKKSKEKRSKRIQGNVTEAEYKEFQMICDEEKISQSDGIQLAITAFIKSRKRKKKRTHTPAGWIDKTSLGFSDPLPPLDQIQLVLADAGLRYEPEAALDFLADCQMILGGLDDWKDGLIEMIRKEQNQ